MCNDLQRLRTPQRVSEGFGQWSERDGLCLAWGLVEVVWMTTTTTATSARRSTRWTWRTAASARRPPWRAWWSATSPGREPRRTSTSGATSESSERSERRASSSWTAISSSWSGWVGRRVSRTSARIRVRRRPFGAISVTGTCTKSHEHRRRRGCRSTRSRVCWCFCGSSKAPPGISICPWVFTTEIDAKCRGEGAESSRRSLLRGARGGPSSKCKGISPCRCAPLNVDIGRSCSDRHRCYESSQSFLLCSLVGGIIGN